MDVLENKLKLDWLDGEWENWKDMVDAIELKQHVEKSNTALEIAQEIRAKGKGKGKPHL